VSKLCRAAALATTTASSVPARSRDQQGPHRLEDLVGSAQLGESLAQRLELFTLIGGQQVSALAAICLA
jgi:hypothetical protein